MPVALQVLILEDRSDDAELELHELRRSGYAPEWRRVETEAQYLEALDPSLDLILADYALPQFDGLRALELLRARGLDIPFIIVSGTIGEDIAVAAMQRGASDYLIKDRLTRLGAAVEHALQQRRLRAEKHRADQLLEASDQRFRALIEHSSDGIALIGGDAVIRYASPSTARILGYAPEMLQGLDSFTLIHPDDQDDIRGRLALLLQQPGQSATAQFRVRHADGGWRWIEIVANNLLAQPSVGALVLNYRDISDRIQAEQALRAAEAKYRLLIEHTPAIVYQAALDERSSTIYVNEQVEKILGFKQAEWMADPQRWLKQLHPHDLEQVLDNVSQAQAGDLPIRSEFRMLTRDGRVVWFGDEAVVMRDAEGRPLFLQGVMLDITARKQAEEQIRRLNIELEQRVSDRTAALERANAELQDEIAERTQLEAQIQQHADRATTLSDVSRLLAEAGHELQPLFDTITEQIARVIGDACILTLFSDDRQSMHVMAIGHENADAIAFMRAMFPAPYSAQHGLAGQVARTGLAVRVAVTSPEQIRAQIKPEYRSYLDRFGMASLLIVPLRSRGRILGTLGVSRDQPGKPYIEADQTFLQELADRAGLAIENARLFVAAEQARLEAERANRAKSAFLASMSHELRTPLNAILGFTGTLLMKLPGPLNPDQERQLLTVQRSGKHLLNLINDLLDLAKIESGKVELRLVPIVCQEVLAEVATALRPLAEEKGLRLAIEAPAEPLVLTSDARALSQILLNLVGNALKFTDAGEVLVSLGRRAEDERRTANDGADSSSVVRPPSVVSFTVRDTGIGITPEDQAKLFTEFGRVDSAAAREREGTGLGLRLSRQLAALLGGTIELESQLGVGSTFTLAIPEPEARSA